MKEPSSKLLKIVGAIGMTAVGFVLVPPVLDKVSKMLYRKSRAPTKNKYEKNRYQNL